MYKKFFNFRERPFQLVPNPAYLYLSSSHEEALAHLSYAISQGDGFIEITGEVGTGKTTLCRSFLENLEEGTEAAYIFNPKLTEIELLKAINDEFAIDSSGENMKALTDRLNIFLMEKKAAGKNIILLVDEAQNLSKPVLEQLRLLSNLETTTSKLIQIILVGQPELSSLLSSYELRQLGQRITLSSKLTPLTLEETRNYIRHRLMVASRIQTAQFSDKAIKLIYKHSRGIPRRINVLSDRALLAAFVDGKKTISGDSVKKVMAEQRENPAKAKSWRYLYAAASLAAVLLVSGAVYGLFNARPEPPQPAPAVPEAKITLPVPPMTSEKKETAEKATQIASTRKQALTSILTLWKVIPDIPETLSQVENTRDFFKLALKQNGLSIHELHGDLEMIRKINLPVILEVTGDNAGENLYIVVSGINGARAEYTDSLGNKQAGSMGTILSSWTGTAFIPWKNYYSITGTIPETSPAESVMALKILMQEIGFNDIETTPEYDPWTEKNIRFFQKKTGTFVDGIVGPVTKILLYNTLGNLNHPSLKKDDEKEASL